MPQEFAAELALVTKRLEWLNLVMSGREEDVSAMINKMTTDAASDAAAANRDDVSLATLSSRDEACVARAGPCPGYEELKPVSCLRTHVTQFTLCATEADLKTCAAEMKDTKTLLNTLISSCKGSVTDLNYAQEEKATRAQKAKESEVTKEKDRLEKKRAAQKAGGEALKKLNVGKHPIFALEGNANVAISRAGTWSPKWSMEEPFLLEGASKDFMELQSALDAQRDFQIAFDESSLKVTEGRAGIPVTPELHKTIARACKSLVPNYKEPVWFDSQMMGETHKTLFPDLHSNLCAQLFGFAAAHLSVAKFELGLMPTLRFAGKGTRIVALVQPRPLVKHLQAQQPKGKVTIQMMMNWLEVASKEDLGNLMASTAADQSMPRSVVIGTVDATDVLYIPPGSLVCQRVLTAVDVIGFKVGIVSSELRAVLEFLKDISGKSASSAMLQALESMQLAESEAKIGAEAAGEAPKEQLLEPGTQQLAQTEAAVAGQVAAIDAACAAARDIAEGHSINGGRGSSGLTGNSSCFAATAVFASPAPAVAAGAEVAAGTVAIPAAAAPKAATAAAGRGEEEQQQKQQQQQQQ